MDYVNLGQTGLKVSRICLGMMTYGTSQWRPWILDEADSRPIVQRAVGWVSISSIPPTCIQPAHRRN